MWRRFLLTGAVLLMSAGSEAAQQSESLCGDRDAVVEGLAMQFKERQEATGVADIPAKNVILEIFVSPEGTWTILATGTDGYTCLVSNGDGWDSKTMVAGIDT